jgi:uncharacterized protein YkwD
MKKSVTIIASIISAIMLSSSCFAMQKNPANSDQNFSQQILQAHNFWRAKHHAPNLVWDESLARYAHDHASNCVFKHSVAPKYGENLIAGYRSIPTAIHAWYAENQLYSYRNPGFSYQTGHFTQLIWKGTTRVGCGYADCAGRNGTPGRYLVCEYAPAGNIIGKKYFSANVLR